MAYLPNTNQNSMNELLEDSLQHSPVIGILRGYRREVTDGVLGAYGAAGLSAIEITLNTPNALHIIKEMVAQYGATLHIGAGTVCSVSALEKALDAGAAFIVTPVLDIDVIHRCKEAGIPVFPGAYTPTEIYRAWDAGASMVKIFPAAQLGPAYIKQLKAPLDQIKVMPTGGISLDNMQTYLNAGASGLGMGSALFEQQYIDAKDWGGLQRHFEKVASLLKNRP
jgi:2-dehydro-3-deoxyphosphogluconate aldolase/(4S)-4-hydroxy-2-oxoglutarate aldolase